MDPNETLALIVQAAIDGDPNELMSAASDLAHWLDNGGFAPSHEALIPILSPQG